MVRLSAFAPYILAGLAAAVAALTAVPARLGAHPWWADQVVFIGLPIGFAVGFVLSRISRGVLVAGALTVATAGIAHIGKLRFAASYAEDQLAGQAWYFGWIATCAALTALCVTVLDKLLRPRSGV